LTSSPVVGLVLVLVAGASLSVYDLHRVERETLVVYTTPALRDVLEKLILPRFEEETGTKVEPVYLSAAAEYYRLKLSANNPEADVFLHASPLYIERGHAEGYFDPIEGVPAAFEADGAARSADGGGHVWVAFAWSPLVEVVHASRLDTPDLATADLRYGIPHPMIANNGVYAALLFESTDPEAGQRAVERSVIQPTNARSNIQGIADQSFDVTVGYEAVGRFYQTLGAQIRFDIPVVNGDRVTIPVLMTAGIVRAHPHEEANDLVNFLLRRDIQLGLARYHLRSVLPDVEPPAGALDLGNATFIEPDWSDWRTIEGALPGYVVNG
jgi:hypothetical protein